MFTPKSLWSTTRFVLKIATPLSLVNSMIHNFNATPFFSEWMKAFALNFMITLPQAVLYVSLVKWWAQRKESKKA